MIDISFFDKNAKVEMICIPNLRIKFKDIPLKLNRRKKEYVYIYIG